MIGGAKAKKDKQFGDPGEGGGPEGAESDMQDVVATTPGLERVFTFADGRTLWDEVLDGTIHDFGSLLSELNRLAGEGGGTVVNTGTTDEPRFVISYEKELKGDTGFDVSFDKFGGHVSLSGSVEASATIHVNLVAGIDAQGFYIETGGTDPELSIGDIHVEGELHGEGQFGFLGVELENPTLTDDRRCRQHQARRAVGQQDPPRRPHRPGRARESRQCQHHRPRHRRRRPACGHQGQALLPGSDEPFELAGATVTIHWDDVTQPTNVRVDFTGAIGDFLKLQVQQLLDKLTQLRDGMDALGANIPFISNGLSSVISVLKAIDENTVSAGTSGGTPSFRTAQDFAGRLSQQLNQEIGGFGLDFSETTLSWDFNLDGPVLTADGSGFAGFTGTLSNLHIRVGVDLAKLVDLGSSFSIGNALSVTVSGEVGDVNLFDVLQGGVKFEVSRRVVDVNVDGGAFPGHDGPARRDADDVRARSERGIDERPGDALPHDRPGGRKPDNQGRRASRALAVGLVGSPPLGRRQGGRPDGRPQPRRRRRQLRPTA